MKYRSKTDIIGHILEAVNSRGGDTGVTKSKIMYTVFLSYPQLQEYLSDLVEKGLIEQIQKNAARRKKDKGKQRSSNYYRITDKGRRFLQIYRDLSEMMIA
jgi:predicted transcriptional regulator